MNKDTEMGVEYFMLQMGQFIQDSGIITTIMEKAYTFIQMEKDTKENFMTVKRKVLENITTPMENFIQENGILTKNTEMDSISIPMEKNMLANGKIASAKVQENSTLMDQLLLMADGKETILQRALSIPNVMKESSKTMHLMAKEFINLPTGVSIEENGKMAKSMAKDV